MYLGICSLAKDIYSMCVMSGKFANGAKVEPKEKTPKEQETREIEALPVAPAISTYFKPIDVSGELSAEDNLTMTIIC